MLMGGTTSRIQDDVLPLSGPREKVSQILLKIWQYFHVHMYVPDDLTAVAWQRGLRRQFGRTQQFELINSGTEKFSTDFKVVNPTSN